MAHPGPTVIPTKKVVHVTTQAMPGSAAEAKRNKMNPSPVVASGPVIQVANTAGSSPKRSKVDAQSSGVVVASTIEKPFRCELCNQIFQDNAAFSAHRRTHPNIKPYHCTECGKSFTRFPYLIIHQRLHNGVHPYECDQCEKKFISQSNLGRHLKSHQADKPYPCLEPGCDKSFARANSLNVHKRIHSGEKPYKCKTCGKSFHTSSILTAHDRIHTGEKPHSCKTCGKGFTHSSHLVVHTRTHTGEKPYECKECSKGFAHKSDLTVHERTHTGSRPYQCDQCGAAFARSGALTKHKKAHDAGREIVKRGRRPRLAIASLVAKAAEEDLIKQGGLLQDLPRNDVGAGSGLAPATAAATAPLAIATGVNATDPSAETGTARLEEKVNMVEVRGKGGVRVIPVAKAQVVPRPAIVGVTKRKVVAPSDEATLQQPEGPVLDDTAMEPAKKKRR